MNILVNLFTFVIFTSFQDTIDLKDLEPQAIIILLYYKLHKNKHWNYYFDCSHYVVQFFCHLCLTFGITLNNKEVTNLPHHDERLSNSPLRVL